MTHSNPGSPLVLAVPVYQSEKFLADTLASLNANGSNLRWWLQDGGSTDRTLSIARQFARAGDRVISAPDGGQTDALNRAFGAMSGEVIGYINGDDVLLPDTAEQVLRYFAKHPEVDLVYGEVDWIDAHGAITGHHAGRIDSLSEVLDLYGVWWKGRQWVQPEVFFRRELAEKVGAFDPAYHLAFDVDFFIRCFRAGARVARLPRTLARFRLHDAQKSTAARRAADEMRTLLRRHLAECPPIPAPRRWAISAQLDYDLYQSSGTAARERRPFLRELLRHPHWLCSRQVRARLRAACTRLSGADRKPA